MARSDTGTSGLGIPASERVSAVDFAGWRHPRDHDQENRENRGGHRQYQNPARASIFDLLFDEVDHTPEIEEPVKQRLKQNVRRSFRQQSGTAPEAPQAARLLSAKPPFPESPPHQHQPRPPPTPADDLVKVVVPTVNAADTEKLIRGVAENDDPYTNEQVLEARRLADQLRYCLSQHTQTAQKVSAYLRALLVLTHGHYKPTMVIEV